MSHYKTTIVVVHFSKDGRAALELQDRGRELGKKIMVKQTAGRQGLSVFVFDVNDINEFTKLISNLSKY